MQRKRPWNCCRLLCVDLAVDDTYLDNICDRPQVRNIFLSEEGDCNTSLACPARPSDTVNIRNSRLREEDDVGGIR